MDLILIPGLWLDASTWDAVTSPLEAAGHRTHPLTLPGMESRDADRSGVTLADQVAAVVAAIDTAYDASGEPVVVVGHSLGAAIGWAAVDARPDRVARGIWVGGFPSPDGSADGRALLTLPDDGAGNVEMPDWVAIGDEEMVVDFSPEQVVAFTAAAIPAPAQVLAGPQRLTDERRYAVPATNVCPEYTAAQLQEWVADGESAVGELARIADVEYVDLPGGHWPQLTQPDALARVILAAVDR